MEDELPWGTLRSRWVAAVTGARRARRGERIQSLWSGYGELFRVELEGATAPSAIVKWVRPPSARGGDASHARKLRSYEVETAWYRTFAPRCTEACRVARLIDSRVSGAERLLLLEDLDEAGFPERRRHLGEADVDACLGWLAALHAQLLGVPPQGLWASGTYWHLATRREELQAIDDAALREAAPILDRRLREATYRTILHGDAKPANFCFGRSGAVAAVDFQYAGGGCGMKDVAYLLCGAVEHGSRGEARALDGYFRHLRAALADRPEPVDADALEGEWRSLYPIACADFYRFLAGWSKAHYASDRAAQRLVREVLRSLGG